MLEQTQSTIEATHSLYNACKNKKAVTPPGSIALARSLKRTPIPYSSYINVCTKIFLLFINRKRQNNLIYKIIDFIKEKNNNNNASGLRNKKRRGIHCSIMCRVLVKRKKKKTL